MPDTQPIAGAREWPRRYTSAEIKRIAASLGCQEIEPVALEMLQKAVEGYQWASVADEGIFASSTNKGRREQLTQMIKLCAPGAPDDALQEALSQLDGPTSHKLGSVSIEDRQLLARAARCILGEIPDSGSDPKRARQQYVGDLARFYRHVKRRRPGRFFFGAPFRDFVMTALTPFNTAGGSDADIKFALQNMNKRKRKKNRCSASKG